MSGDADKILTEWQEKLEALLEAEVIATAADEKYRLKTQIAAARRKVAAREKEIASAAGKLKSPIPNNLPRLQPFFGREKELAVIREALDPDNRTWGALIDGPGGMGKTSLAVRAAYDCAPEQFDRILFVSVKDREMDDDGPRALGNFLIPGLLELLNELARQLGQADIQKSPEDQRMRLLHETLGGTKSLLILDNLESLSKDDRGHILTFVKRLPQGCKAILTSRRRIGSGSELLILEKLDQDAALKTLADLALRNPLLARTTEAERIALYTQTGGKPLLLRWTAGQLGRGSCRTFTEALAFLRSCPPDNDPLDFIFGDLAQEFTPDEERVLAALTYFTLPARVAHIAVVARLEEPPAETALRALSNRSLVTPDQEEKEYALVPLVAEFMRRHRKKVVDRAGRALKRRVSALIEQNGGTQYHKYTELDAMWPVIAATLPRFRVSSDRTLQKICHDLRFYLEFTGHWDEWRSLWDRAEARAKGSKNFDLAGTLACQTGWMHYRYKDAQAVLACAERAKNYWKINPQDSVESNHKISEQAFYHRTLGHGLRLEGDYGEALRSFEKSLRLYQRLDPVSHDVAIALNAIATVKRHAGDLKEAGRFLKLALRMARITGFKEGIASYTGGFARLAIARKRWRMAEKFAREALKLSEELGRRELIARACHRLASSLLEQKRPGEGSPHAWRAMEIYIDMGSPNWKAARAKQAECEEAMHLYGTG
jgi:tetratricopeptide (TPR) repeat protein